MPELNAQVEQQIAAALSARGRATREQLSSVPPADRGGTLYLYYLAHSQEQQLHFEGTDLVAGEMSYGAPPATQPHAQALPTGPHTGYRDAGDADPYPVFAQQRSALDVEREGERVSGWFWLLPFGFGLIGGVLAWALTREANRRMARAFLISGVAVSVISGCLSVAAMRSVGALVSNMPASYRSTSTSSSALRWPAPTAGRPVLYYFGTPT